jgi:hypothetical protein
MVDVEPVLHEYAKTMRQAQLFESALQVVATVELELPDRELTSEELQARTERFFSRGIGWIQRRLDLAPELAQEIDALRVARNDLAHDYLLRFEWLRRSDRDGQSGPTAANWPPEHLRDEFDGLMNALEQEHAAEARAAVGELRGLRSRFEACISTLSSRWFSGLGLREVSSWSELEQSLEETGWRRTDAAQ